MSDPMDGHLQPVLSDDEIRALDDATHFHESLDWTLRFARAVEQRVLAALAARAGQAQRPVARVTDAYRLEWTVFDLEARGLAGAYLYAAPPPLPAQAREAMERTLSAITAMIERRIADRTPPTLPRDQAQNTEARSILVDIAALRAALDGGAGESGEVGR